ncbi:hypothetical protein BGZ99_010319, partial [Dissophora globulifera]
MSLTTQTFKFGSLERKLFLKSSETIHESQFIYVADVLQVFDISDSVNTVKFETDGVSITYMRDGNGFTYIPRRISCHKGVIEVIDETALRGPAVSASTIAREQLNEPIDLLSISSKVSRFMDSSEPLHPGLLSRSTMTIQEDMKTVTEVMVARNRAGKTLDGVSILKESLPAEFYTNVAACAIANPEFQSRVMEKLDEIHKDVKEGLELSKQMNDRLILIQSKTDAILTQSYELHEFIIPRLFIVLPETPTFWNPTTMLSTKFRLHFICECGEHTKPANGVHAPTSKIHHELHIAKHEGYVVRRPTEFFKKYGPFLMVMLEVIKRGTGIAGGVVPVVSTISSVTSRGIDYSLKYLEEIRTHIRQSNDVDVDNDAQALQQDLT